MHNFKEPAGEAGFFNLEGGISTEPIIMDKQITFFNEEIVVYINTLEGFYLQNLVGCRNEYGTLKKVIVCKPKYITVSDTIEEAQRHLHNKAISIDMALKQHCHFVSVLEDYGLEVIYLQVFNILSPVDALIYPEEIHNEKIKYLESRYNLIEVSQEEQATLGTNVLSIGNKRVISLPVNENVNKQLRALNYEVIEVELAEIIKAGGAFRCCTLPILRE